MSTKQLMSFKTKTVEIYVESSEINGVKKYQALYASGEAITEMSTNKDFVVEEAIRVISNTARLLISKNEEL